MIYDITQPLLECRVFPGDPEPEKTIINSIADGDMYNLTAISLCVHNGTHVDAPCHFVKDADGIDKVPLEKFIGPAFVITHTGDVTAEDADSILRRAAAASPQAAKRILIRGDATVTLQAAQVFADAGIYLIGNESQTVGPEDRPAAVHLVLLSAQVILLEGIRLSQVPDGVYLLNCAPLNITGSDGSPCRATLMDM